MNLADMNTCRCKTDMIKGTVAMDTILSAGDAITVECSEGSFFSGGAPTKICGNDGKLHPSGGLCVPNGTILRKMIMIMILIMVMVMVMIMIHKPTPSCLTAQKKVLMTWCSREVLLSFIEESDCSKFLVFSEQNIRTWLPINNWPVQKTKISCLNWWF